MQQKKPNIIERFLYGPAGRAAVDAGELKGLFPFDATYRANQHSWNAPSPNGYGIYYGGHIDYAVETADLVDNSAVMACFLWIMRTFPEARIRVMKRQRTGKPVEVDAHPLTRLWQRPNPFYSGRLMMQPGTISFNWRGDCYFRKIRNGAKQVIELYYEPHWTCRPVRASAKEFISYYQLYRDNRWEDVPREDIIHIRYGLDPENPMHGLSPLAAALREVYTDNAAARYSSAMMRNLGVPGMIVTPKNPDDDLGDPGNPNSLPRLKAELKQLTTGDNRGDPLLYSIPLDITFPQIDPAKMDTRDNRKITEERISGLLGVPAIVAGLGAGLDRSTFANMAEAREMAYESNIIPTQALWADELNTQLLNELGDPDTEYVDWDYSGVRVLQDDENKKAMKYATLYNAGLIKRGEARADLGYDVLPEDDMFKVASNVAAALVQSGDEDGTLNTPQDASTATTDEGKALNGNGHHTSVVWASESKAGRKQTRAQIEAAIQRETEDEIARVYGEAAGKV
jgi:HK97 family phage portal protein